MIKEPEPAPERHTFRHDVAPFDCAVCGEEKGAAVHRPDPVPSIPEACDLITAGDGVSRVSRSIFGDGRVWYPFNSIKISSGLTDDEILALGPVRQAVVVTLPSRDPDRPSADLMADEYVDDWGSDNAKTYAAELLAAALAAEEGR